MVLFQVPRPTRHAAQNFELHCHSIRSYFESNSNASNHARNVQAKPYAELAELLKNASMEDNTVIVTSINQAYAAPGSLLDLFLESFRLGEGTARLLDHLLIVAVDPGALQTCRSVHRHCYLLRPDGAAADTGAEKHYMTAEYLDMMWARNRFQLTILELGFNFLFTVYIHTQASTLHASRSIS